MKESCNAVHPCVHQKCLVPHKVKCKVRPDLYQHDPNIFKKLSTYQKSFTDYKLKKPFEFYGQWDTISKSKFTILQLLQSFGENTPVDLRYDMTTTGLTYRNPKDLSGVHLIKNYFTESENVNRIISAENEKCQSAKTLGQSISTTHKHYVDHREDMTNGIAKKDVITYYNDKEKNQTPLITGKKYFNVPRRTYFKVPFFGDVSTYGDDYRGRK
ncbi:hypothetical protein TKK_0014129 [Trichogramma kaykai]